MAPRAFLASLDRLVAFAATRRVTHVLGCHVEMTRDPGCDYPLGARFQPGERPLEMSTAQLSGVRDAAASVAATRGMHRFPDFIIFNEPRKRDMLRLLARGLAHRVRHPQWTQRALR